ncbi:MAG TPA: glycosyltransferase family 2 protein [Polyangia bacterium]|nr:glycosyltransferase family 2 protein [Polyangia bacterium]
MDKPKVAVITRTKNRKVLLSRALDSVLEQRFTDWIHVIVNDGGDPAEVEALLAPLRVRYGDRLKLIHHERSKGMEAASNAGIHASDSDYVVIHDDDDSWHPEFLAECVEYLEHNATIQGLAGVVTHSQRVLEDVEDGRIVNVVRLPYNNWLRGLSLFRMAASNSFPPISFVFKRAILADVGYFREDLPVLGDWDFHLRVLRKYDLGLIARELAYYHFRRDSTHGEYSNTVTGAVDKHLLYDTLLRNEWLRKDLDSGRIGLGMLVNVAKSFEELRALAGANTAFSYVKDKVYNLAKKARLL